MSGLPVAGSKPGGYVPPSLKNRAAGETVDSRKREENSLRVTNLSEDTREEDLRVSHPSHAVRDPDKALALGHMLRNQKACLPACCYTKFRVPAFLN